MPQKDFATFRVAFKAGRKTYEATVAVGQTFDGRDGLPGSLLQIGLSTGVPIEHACGGVGACATCHVIVRQGLQSCNPASDEEQDRLDQAPGVTPQSRLACKTVPDGGTDLLVEVPAWNRNINAQE